MIMHHMDKKQIIDAIHEMDLALRPYIIYAHPKNKEKIRQVLKEIGRDDFLIQATPLMDEDKIIILKREILEPDFKTRTLDAINGEKSDDKDN